MVLSGTHKISKQKVDKKLRNHPRRRPLYMVIPKIIECEYRYFIRGDIVIDIPSIKKEKMNSCFDCKDYRPTVAVSLLK